jgi:integrase
MRRLRPLLASSAGFLVVTSPRTMTLSSTGQGTLHDDLPLRAPSCRSLPAPARGRRPRAPDHPDLAGKERLLGREAAVPDTRTNSQALPPDPNRRQCGSLRWQTGGLSKRWVQALFTCYATLADLPPDRRHVHTMRHSMATHLLDAGEPIDFVQDHLGHRDRCLAFLKARMLSARTRANLRLGFRRSLSSMCLSQTTRTNAETASAG